MKRREILKYTAYATGAAVCSPLLGTILTGCSMDSSNYPDDFTPQFFNEDEFRVINSIVDTILPKTSSPAASEVGVDKMIDTFVGTVYSETDRADYREHFIQLNTFLQDQASGKAFNKLTEIEKLALLQQLESQDSNPEDVKAAYLELKQQTIAYYLTTEEVATNFLNYLPVPGEYEPCIPLADVGGKAWAL
jgi:hypothetical protein